MSEMTDEHIRDLFKMVISSIVVASRESRKHRKDLKNLEEDDYAMRMLRSIADLAVCINPTYISIYCECMEEVLRPEYDISVHQIETNDPRLN